MIKKFLRLILFLVSIINFKSTSTAQDQPDSLSKQYRDWVYRCVNVNKENQCEIVQTLTINKTNIQFTFSYSNFINDENELKETFNIITPLGINLKEKVEIKFYEGKAIKLSFSKCEVFGCVISVTNNSSDDVVLNIFNQIKKSMKKSIFFELKIDAFQKDPLVIKSSLQGFVDAYKDSSNSKS